MAGFDTIDQIINAGCYNGKKQRLHFNKTLPSTTVVKIPHTFWKSTGVPPAGADTSAGAGNGRTCTSATSGGMTFTNPVAPATMHLLNAEIMTVTTSTFQGMMMLVDRISDVNLSLATIGTTSITGLDATSRLDSGEGAKLWVEVTAALGAAAASATITITYTASDGTSGRTTTIVPTASAAIGRSINERWFQDLNTSDTGIRSIQSYSITSGTTGNFNLCLVRPLVVIPVANPCVITSKDLIMEMPSLPRIRDDACLTWLTNSAAAMTGQIAGSLTISEN